MNIYRLTSSDAPPVYYRNLANAVKAGRATDCWLQKLEDHPLKGKDLVIALLNDSCVWTTFRTFRRKESRGEARSKRETPSRGESGTVHVAGDETKEFRW